MWTFFNTIYCKIDKKAASVWCVPMLTAPLIISPTYYTVYFVFVYAMAYSWASSVTNFIVVVAQFFVKIVTVLLKPFLCFVRKNGATPWWQNILPLRRRQAALKIDLERSPSSRIYRFVIRKSCFKYIFCCIRYKNTIDNRHTVKRPKFGNGT